MPPPHAQALRTNALRCAVATFLLFGAACGFDVQGADLAFKTQPFSRDALKEHPAAFAALEKGLGERFGTPAAPRYPLLEDWRASGFDPARAEPPADGGGTGEIDAGERDRIQADNASRYATELVAIGRGAFDAVDEPRAQAALHAKFSALVADASVTEDAKRARAAELFRDHYPTLAESAELYRVECLHCHGTSGGGDGPTSNFIEPRPRDFRLGVFKWTSTSDAARPTRDDLLRVLDLGVYGTSMPSFQRLSQAQRHGLADYVRFLAVRGEVERQVVLAFEDEEEITDATFDDALELVWGKWERAKEKVVVWDGLVPEPTPEAIALGEALYRDPRKGNCAACHGFEGRGDGPVAYKIDDSGSKVSAYQDVWGFDILPRNLRRDPFRGGRRPIDLYRRIRSGIAGGPMPAMSGILSPDETWALVHYTRTLAEKALEDELAARSTR